MQDVPRGAEPFSNFILYRYKPALFPVPAPAPRFDAANPQLAQRCEDHLTCSVSARMKMILRFILTSLCQEVKLLNFAQELDYAAAVSARSPENRAGS